MPGAPSGSGTAEVADLVGPVFVRGLLSNTLVQVLCAHHPDAQVRDRGAYLRVLVPRRCQLLRAAVEARLGRAFVLPADLEEVMPSFQGTLSMSDDEAVWSAGGQTR